MTTEDALTDLISRIEPVNEEAGKKCRQRWKSLAKPIGSLGLLEDSVIRLAKIRGGEPFPEGKAALVVFCADHGVTAEGVSQTDSKVTAIVAENMLHHKTTASILCREAGVDLYPLDVGMDRDTEVRMEKISRGTGNILREDAMSRENAAKAVLTGAKEAMRLVSEGYRTLMAGEMGIGNTTVAAALTSVLTGEDPDRLTGRGAGLPESAWIRKKRVVRESIRNRCPNPSDPLDLISKLGGFELAAMCGFYLGAAACRVPAILDGTLSLCSALLAVHFQKNTEGYLLFSHASPDPAAQRVLREFGAKPVIQAEMFPGEGCGAVYYYEMLKMTAAVWKTLPEFEAVSIDPYQEYQ